jgi:hypothetical protein
LKDYNQQDRIADYIGLVLDCHYTTSVMAVLFLIIYSQKSLYRYRHELTVINIFFLHYLLPPSLEMIKMMSAITPTTTRIPTQTPALNIPPITSQLLRKKVKKISKDARLRIENLFFMFFLLC